MGANSNLETPLYTAHERVEVQLRFEGPDVDDGTMSLGDIVPVLQGFAGAYAKLAETDHPEATHRVKITAVRQGSADIVLEVWRQLVQNAEQIAAFASAGGSAFGIIATLIKVIQIKRHVQDQPFQQHITANNSVVIVSSGNSSLEIPSQVYDLFKEGRLNKELELLTRPLKNEGIYTADVEATAADGEVLRERITAEERPYFEIEDLVVTSTRKTQRIVTLISAHKGTNNGSLFLTNGKRASYSYKGDDHPRLHRIFGTVDGPVKVHCTEKSDEDGEVVSLDIYDIERLQPDLFDSHTADTLDED